MNEGDIEDKFIVLNKKRFEELKDNYGNYDISVHNLISSLNKFCETYELKTGKKLNQKYIVCNQDEFYADKIWEIIKANEGI